MNEEETVLIYLKNKIKNTVWDNKVYLVGGSVRDFLMGLKPKDLDFVVNSDLNGGINFSIWLAKQLGVFKEGSNPVIYPRFGTSKLSLKNNNEQLPNLELEFVAPRVEKYTSGSRKPDVENGTLKDDVMRRDYTVNSLMQNVSNGEILDLTGNGVNDIKNKILRTTSDPNIIFKDDPLRMMRGVRQSIKFGFKMLPEVLEAIKENAHLIETISKERINDELNKILLTNNPEKGMELLKDSGLLNYIIPEFKDAIGMMQNKYHNKDVWGHTMDVLSKTPNNLNTRLMGLFHDIGKTLVRSVTPEGDVHFYDHENVAEDIVKNIMTRLKYPNNTIDAVISGVKNHMSLKSANDSGKDISDKALRKFKTRVGDNLEDILSLIHADNISHADESSMPNQIENIKKRLENLNDEVVNNRPKLPINGDDLIKMGFKPSPLFKDILARIEDAWYENPQIIRDEAIEIVNQMKNENSITEAILLIKKIDNL